MTSYVYLERPLIESLLSHAYRGTHCYWENLFGSRND